MALHCGSSRIDGGGGEGPAAFVKIFRCTVHIYCSILCHSLVFIAQVEMIMLPCNGLIYFVVC